MYFHALNVSRKLLMTTTMSVSGAGAVFGGGVVKIAIVEMDVVVWWYYMYSGVDYTCRVSWIFFLLNHPASMKIRPNRLVSSIKNPPFKTAWR